MSAQKILIIRFSSIGDIVLTTPLVRCIKQQFPETELHYVTKESFRSVLMHNPHINKLHTFENEVSELFEQLRGEKYDCVIDLHKNLRSLRLKNKLKVQSFSFNKINFEKFMAVNFKMLRLLPQKHIVDRYFETLASLGVKNDGLGLEYYINKTEEINVWQRYFNGHTATKYLTLVVGGSYYTKKIPLSKLTEICRNAVLPVILLGGKDDRRVAEDLHKMFPQVINTCGTLSINQSASLIQQCEWVITSDTGMMHIASAFNKKIVSVWGNTIPEFGMSAYLPRSENKVMEVTDLKCRPCSKLGFNKCPAGHFRCMMDQDFSAISKLN